MDAIPSIVSLVGLLIGINDKGVQLGEGSIVHVRLVHDHVRKGTRAALAMQCYHAKSWVTENLIPGPRATVPAS